MPVQADQTAPRCAQADSHISVICLDADCAPSSRCKKRVEVHPFLMPGADIKGQAGLHPE